MVNFSLFNKHELVRLPEGINVDLIKFPEGQEAPFLVLSPVLKEVEKILLRKIMASINRSSDKDFIHSEISEEYLVKPDNCWLNQNTVIISFGVPFAALGWQISTRPYAISSLGTARMIYSDSLQKIGSSPQLKQKLWASLKLLNLD